MEWIILVVLVPAVIVPIVLLFGFAGCSSFGTETAPPPSPPAGPFELVAKAVSETQIDLAWKHNSMGGVKFIVSFLGPDGVWNENYATVTEKSLPSASLSPGVSYSYRVRATLGSGNDSGPSNTATTRTWKWEEFYNKPPTDNEGAFPGDCLVQRIDKALLTYSGDAMKVRLTLRGSANAANAALAIDRLSISHAASPSAANPAPQLWDSAAPVMLLPGSVPPLPGNGTPVTLAPIDFAVDKTRDLIVAFDIKAGNASPTIRRTTDIGTSTAYTRNDAAEAASDNRTPVGALPAGSTGGWATRAGVYLIERIEVLRT